MKIIITGSTKGIGKAITNKFAGLASDLFLTSRNIEALELQKQELISKYPSLNVFIFSADFSIKEEVNSFASFVNDQSDSIDILINNVGLFIPGNILEEQDGDFEKIMATNISSVYYLCRAVAPNMVLRKQGHIFNICSVASLKAYPNGGSYSISKFALYGFTQNLREELRSTGVKVTAVIPGATWTDSWSGSGVEEERLMNVDDIATSIWSATQLSQSAVVEEIVLRPIKGDL